MRTSVTALSLLAGVLMMPAIAQAQDAPRVDKPVIPMAASAAPAAVDTKTDLEGPGIDLNAPPPAPVAAAPAAKPVVRSASADDEFPAQVPAVRSAPRREATALPSDDRCRNVYLPVIGGNPTGVYDCD